MKRGNLLIIDDEPLILKTLEKILSDYADKIYTAERGAAGLELLKNNEIHCVICDINMPGMNGVEVVKTIRASGNDIPFIFYTGHGNRDLMLEAVKYGVFDFLNKPDLDGIEEVVSRGIKTGFDKAYLKEDDSYLSDYDKLLNEALE